MRGGDDLVGAELGQMCPQGLRSGVEQLDQRHVGALVGSEITAVRGAVAARRTEFATGRALLRRLLGTGDEIPVEPDRSPRFDGGVVGSLAHSGRLAVGVVGERRRFRSVGVDLERAGAVGPGESASVLRSGEQVDPTVGFVLKEAAYKAWNGLGGDLLDFHDLSVEVNGNDAVVTVLGTSCALRAKWTSTPSWVLALVVQPA